MRPCALSLLLVLALSACGGPAPIDDGGTDAGTGCARDEDCDDGLFCTGAERCVAGSCEVTPACESGESCDETGDVCSAAPCETEPDADGDGVDSMECGGTDCDDADELRYPGAIEVCDDDDRDEDCDPDTYGARDSDRDGLDDARCANVIDGVGTSAGEDCDDARRTIQPGSPEVCNALDDDCDGSVDEGVEVAGFADVDRDLHGDPDVVMRACAGASGFSTIGDDCDDTDVTIHGGMGELCDVVDNDCDGRVDESMVSVPWYSDSDADAYGTAGTSTASCTPIAGSSILPLDCDGADGTRHPGAPELCNGVDDDCNGLADHRIGVNDWEDDDDDGYTDAACGAGIVEPDCLDSDPLVHPGAPERCGNRIDDDCDGAVDDGCGTGPADAGVDASIDGGTCSADVLEDPMNCGGCGMRCRPRPWSAPACSGGFCDLACESGRGDCNHILADGCEVAIHDDELHCGGCGVRCLEGESCVGDRCVAPVLGSSGAEGAFDPASDVVLDPGRHDFTTIRIRPGVTVRTRGDGWLDLRASGAVVIEGAIDVSGGRGGQGTSVAVFGNGGGGSVGSTIAGATGIAGACQPPGGGGLGTTGGDAPGTGCGLGGNRAGGGAGGAYSGGGGGGGFAGGGGGGGFTAAGAGASTADATGGAAGVVGGAGGGGGGSGIYAGFPGTAGAGCGGGGGGAIGEDAAADLAVATTFRTGSSGGGGGGSRASTTTAGGTGGGGGGGGAIRIASSVSIRITSTGRVLADGGDGGNAAQYVCGGGGGSGGVVWLAAPSLEVEGDVSAVGGAAGRGGGGIPAGAPGGIGGVGRVRISAAPARCQLDGLVRPPPISGCDPMPATPGRAYVAIFPE